MTMQAYDPKLQTNPYAIYTLAIEVEGKQILTDQEGYIQNVDEWSKGFAEALAKQEGLVLTDKHWDIIEFLREYYQEHRVQAPVRDILKHFKKAWGAPLATNHYLHEIFPKGGPQKQGNRLAGIRKTKGEH